MLYSYLAGFIFFNNIYLIFNIVMMFSHLQIVWRMHLLKIVNEFIIRNDLSNDVLILNTSGFNLC